jgi:hypothetical protein
MLCPASRQPGWRVRAHRLHRGTATHIPQPRSYRSPFPTCIIGPRHCQDRQLKLKLPYLHHPGGSVQRGLSDAMHRRAYAKHLRGVR